jgi:hypothetical protein
MKRQVLVFLATFGILVAFGGVTSIGPATLFAAATPEDVAQQELPRWLNMVRNDDVKAYGFTSEDELTIATLGTPHQVFTLAPEAVQSYQPGQSVASLITEEPWWEFPVLVNGQARGLLSVAQVDGQWQGVGFGAFLDSQKVIRLQQRLAKQNASVKLVKFTPTEGTFALVEQDKRETLVHMSSLPGLFMEIDRNNLTPYSPQDFMPKVKKAFGERVAAEQERQQREKDQGQQKP